MTENNSRSVRDEVAPRVAVLTGGSRGIGRSSVLNLAARRINVIFTYNSNADAAKEMAAEAGKYGPRISALQLDVTKVDTFDGFVGQLRDELAALSGTSTAIRNSRSGSSSVHGVSIAPPSSVASSVTGQAGPGNAFLPPSKRSDGC